MASQVRWREDTYANIIFCFFVNASVSQIHAPVSGVPGLPAVRLYHGEPRPREFPHRGAIGFPQYRCDGGERQVRGRQRKM